MKNDTTKTTRKKMKAPGFEEEDHARSRSSWPDKALEFVYRHQALRDFLYQDPVMRILQSKQIEDPQRPERAPMQTSNKLTAVKDLLRLLTDAGIVAGAFDAEDLFELDLDLIQSMTRDLFNKIKFIVGEALQIPDPTSSPRISQPASSNYASAAEEDSLRQFPDFTRLDPSCLPCSYDSHLFSVQRATSTELDPHLVGEAHCPAS
ncbi:hypothetical protein PI126_g23700 [Phytophthora idaei]|nr:hypothetical protein PI126_g23700 [Phytophthora idaei]